MSTASTLAFIWAGGLLTAACVLTTAKAEGKKPASLGDLVTNYRSWTKLNRKPVYMKPFIAALCAPTPKALAEDNPHVPKYFTIYVNDTGRRTIYEEKPAKYPVGTVIVKE